MVSVGMDDKAETLDDVINRAEKINYILYLRSICTCKKREMERSRKRKTQTMVCL